MKKYTSFEKNFVTARLKSGDNYIESLLEVAKKKKITSSFILNSIGMLKDVELAFFEGKGQYKINKLEGPLEVTSVQGNIGTTKDGELKTHIHITLSDKDGKAFGGHLQRGTVWVTAEILLLKLGKIELKRELEKDTGLFGLFFG